MNLCSELNLILIDMILLIHYDNLYKKKIKIKIFINKKDKYFWLSIEY